MIARTVRSGNESPAGQRNEPPLSDKVVPMCATACVGDRRYKVVPDRDRLPDDLRHDDVAGVSVNYRDHV